MPPDPTVDVDADDSELSDLASLSAFDEAGYRRMLESQGLPEAQIELMLTPMRNQAQANQKFLAREQRRDNADYKSKLVEQFPYASPDLITGSTKAEMRRSAERIHKHTETLVTAASAKVATPATPATPAAPVARTDGRSGESEWVQPPASATTIVSDRPVPNWDGVRKSAMGGSARAADSRPSAASKEAALADIAANGPRPIARASFQTIVARGGGQPEK